MNLTLGRSCEVCTQYAWWGLLTVKNASYPLRNAVSWVWTCIALWNRESSHWPWTNSLFTEGTTIPLYDPTISYMAISSNHIQSNSGQLYTVHMAFAAADCSAEGTVSILNRGLDVHGGAAAGGLLLLLGLHRSPNHKGNPQKHGFTGKTLGDVDVFLGQ